MVSSCVERERREFERCCERAERAAADAAARCRPCRHGDYVLSGALKWPFWDKMSHFVQTFVWRNGWVSGLLWDIDGFVMKFLAMPRRPERRYLPRLGVQNGNLPQNGCGGKASWRCS